MVEQEEEVKRTVVCEMRVEWMLWAVSLADKPLNLSLEFLCRNLCPISHRLKTKIRSTLYCDQQQFEKQNRSEFVTSWECFD